MSKRRRRPRQQGPRNWDRLLARAERDLAKNREQIDESPRGTPGRKASDWRLGKGPGSGKEWRR